MKKLLLFLFAALAVVGVKAETWKYSAAAVPGWNDYLGSGSPVTVSGTLNGVDWQVALTYASNTNRKEGYLAFNGSIGALQMGSSNAAHTSAVWTTNHFVGSQIESVIVTAKSNKTTKLSVKVGDTVYGEFNLTNTKGSYTFTGSAMGALEIAYNCPGGGTHYLYDITVVYSAPAPTSSVATPTFTLTEGEWSHSVAMACETEGAEIHYTTDGSEPTAESTLYTEPVEISETTLFKAVAVANGEQSAIGAFNAQVPYILDGFSNLIGADMNADVIIKAPITVVHTYGSRAIVKCDDSYMQFAWSALPTDVVAGATFSRVDGTYVASGAQPEVNVSSIGAVTDGIVPEPAEAGIGQVTAANLFQYLKLKNVNISDALGRTAVISGTGENGDAVTVDGYQQFDGSAEWPLKNGCDITGFVGVYRGAVQFWPVKIEGGMDILEAPAFTPADGTEAERGTAVTIESGDSAAEIWWKYSTDTEFVNYSVETPVIPANAAIGSKVTLVAYAKTETAISPEVSATYTVIKSNPGLQWCDPATGEPVTEMMFILNKDDLSKLPLVDGILDGEVTMSSSNPAVASIDTETMGIVINALGTAVITVSVAETPDYTAAEASFTLRVTDGQSVSSTFSMAVLKPNYSATSTTITFVDAESGLTFKTTARKSQSGGNWPTYNGASYELRLYSASANELDVEAPGGYAFRSVTVVSDSESGNKPCLPNINGIVAEQQTVAANGPARATAVYATYSAQLPPANDGKQPGLITIKPEPRTDGVNGQLRINSLTFEVAPVQTGVTSVTADQNAPAEYYNLQGIRVARPTQGVYLRRQGGVTTKVVL